MLNLFLEKMRSWFERNLSLSEMSLKEMDLLWEEQKLGIKIENASVNRNEI